jgi:hypothetical protein
MDAAALKPLYGEIMTGLSEPARCSQQPPPLQFSEVAGDWVLLGLSVFGFPAAVAPLDRSAAPLSLLAL